MHVHNLDIFSRFSLTLVYHRKDSLSSIFLPTFVPPGTLARPKRTVPAAFFQKTIINNILTHTTSPRQSSSKNYILIFVYPSTKKSVVTIQILSHPFLHQFPSCTLLPYDILLFSHIAFLPSEVFFSVT